MGQKVNPHGFRVGVIKDWDTRWFANGKAFADNLISIFAMPAAYSFFFKNLRIS